MLRATRRLVVRGSLPNVAASPTRHSGPGTGRCRDPSACHPIAISFRRAWRAIPRFGSSPQGCRVRRFTRPPASPLQLARTPLGASVPRLSNSRPRPPRPPAGLQESVAGCWDRKAASRRRMAMVPTACIDIVLAHRSGGSGGRVRLLVHGMIMLVWTMAGATAGNVATTKRISTTATATSSAKITAHAGGEGVGAEEPATSSDWSPARSNPCREARGVLALRRGGEMVEWEPSGGLHRVATRTTKRLGPASAGYSPFIPTHLPPSPSRNDPAVEHEE